MLRRRTLRDLRRYWIDDVIVGSRLWLLHQALRVLPTDVASKIGGTIAVHLASRLYRRSDARARDVLRSVRPDLAADETLLSAAMAQAWDSIGRTHAEFSAEDRIWNEGRIAVEGADNLKIAQSDGRPLMVAGVHLGNWELIPIALGYLGHRIIDVYQPQPNRFVDAIAKRSRMRAARAVGAAVKQGTENIFTLVAPSPRAGNELVRAIKAGWTLMMYVDEQIGNKVISPSFGDQPPTEGNMTRIIKLGRLTGAAIVPAYIERTTGARFIVHFLPALSTKDGYPVSANELNATIASIVRRHVNQWFMLISYRMTSA